MACVAKPVKASPPALQAFPEQVWAVSVSISAELLLHEAGLRHITQLQQIDRAWAQHGALQRAASGAAIGNSLPASFCLNRLEATNILGLYGNLLERSNCS